MKRWLAIFGLLIAASASAHEVQPAFLGLTERAPGEFDVLWKVPAMGGTPLAGEELPRPQPSLVDPSAPTATMPCGCPAPTAAQLSRGVLPVHPSLPKHAVITSLPQVERIFGAEMKRWSISTGAQGLDGWEVTGHGLQATMTDVLVRIALADGRVVSRLLRPDAPSFVFGKETAGPAAGGYFLLGVEHILFGIDHLLFVLVLVLVVRGVGLLVKTITAFTIAHSITLALATLGFVKVPPAPVEAVIALSIVFVAAEILRSQRGERGLTERAPWLVAFTPRSRCAALRARRPAKHTVHATARLRAASGDFTAPGLNRPASKPLTVPRASAPLRISAGTPAVPGGPRRKLHRPSEAILFLYA